MSKTAGLASYEYLFDLGGRAVTELLAGTATTNRTEAYAGGRRVARIWVPHFSRSLREVGPFCYCGPDVARTL